MSGRRYAFAVGTGTGKTFRAGKPHTLPASQPESSCRVRRAGSAGRDASASRPWPTTSGRARTAATTRRRIYVRRARHATIGGPTVIRSNWKTRRGRLAEQYPTAGDDEALLVELRDIIAEYSIEAASARTDVLCARLWNAASTLDRIRLLFATGQYPREWAELWRDAAREHLRDALSVATTRRVH